MRVICYFPRPENIWQWVWIYPQYLYAKLRSKCDVKLVRWGSLVIESHGDIVVRGGDIGTGTIDVTGEVGNNFEEIADAISNSAEWQDHWVYFPCLDIWAD